VEGAGVGRQGDGGRCRDLGDEGQGSRGSRGPIPWEGMSSEVVGGFHVSGVQHPQRVVRVRVANCLQYLCHGPG
jgi:hypothetical protein